MKKAIGIDLGRSPAIALLVDLEGNVLQEYRLSFSPETPFVEVLEAIKSVIRNLYIKGAVGIGLGVPGNLDSTQGICRFSPNFPTWKEVQMIKPLRRSFKLPVFILNDANAAAMGEKYFGAAKKTCLDATLPIYLNETKVLSLEKELTQKKEFKNVIYLVVGVGVGGGIILNNELVVGTHESAGEIGHITLEPNGPLCTCGNRGCLEAFSSLWALQKEAGEAIKKGERTILTTLINDPQEIDFQVLRECVRQSDELILRLLSRAGRYIGLGVSIMVNILDPEVIIIGGEMEGFFSYIYPSLYQELTERVKMFRLDKIKIVRAKLGELSGAMGAAALVFKRLFKF